MLRFIAGRMLDRFAARYRYDVSYMRAMLGASPSAFMKWAKVTRLAQHCEAAPKEAYFAAKLVGAAFEDCSPCVQLVVDMAREAGVKDQEIEAVLKRDARAMSEAALIAFRFAAAITRRTADEDPAREAVRAAWSEKGVVDLTLATQVSRLFPMVKAGLGYAKTCVRVDIGGRAVEPARTA